MWPDWTIFKVFGFNFFTKVGQIFVKFWGFLENITFLIKNYSGYYFGSFSRHTLTYGHPGAYNYLTCVWLILIVLKMRWSDPVSFSAFNFGGSSDHHRPEADLARVCWAAPHLGQGQKKDWLIMSYCHFHSNDSALVMGHWICRQTCVLPFPHKRLCFGNSSLDLSPNLRAKWNTSFVKFT